MVNRGRREVGGKAASQGFKGRPRIHRLPASRCQEVQSTLSIKTLTENLTDNLKPNLVEYSRRKQDLTQILEMGLADNQEYRIATSALDNKPSENSVGKMVRDLDKTIEKRLKFSKRKAINPDDDVTFINDRNMKFNQKVSRAYDKYTNDIKAAFERGTALE